MIIDFHTHIFPDAIAKRTMDRLTAMGSTAPFSDGTAAGLLSRMAEYGVDLSVNLPVLTAPRQFESTNRFAAESNAFFADKSRRILSFAGIHPACEELEKKMVWIKENGFLGVKIHPDYQATFITDERYVRILECARDLDLIVLTHAGVDGGLPDCVHCPPSMVRELIRKVPHSKLVLAHYGGHLLAEEVLDTLCGEDVYFDTALAFQWIDEELFKKVLDRHGEDRVLFASDSPWSNVKKDLERLRSFSLGKETEEKILSSNARKLLGI